jgi:hypothetical protein
MEGVATYITTLAKESDWQKRDGKLAHMQSGKNDLSS